MALEPDRIGLVLGGGGITGIAWELGMLHGLATHGLDLSNADVVVGTSAGSVVGTLISSVSLDDALATQFEPPDPAIGAEFGRLTMLKLAPLVLMPGSNLRKRRRIGSAALRAHPAGGRERIDIIAERISTTDWPDRDLRITAVDAESGRFKVFTRSSDVDLVHAVAASCAVPLIWPAVTIGGRQYVDGGMRSPTNADVARDCDVIVVLAPLPSGYSRTMSLRAQLGRTGARDKIVISPDKLAVETFGSNVLDHSKRTVAAEAGLRQAAETVERLRETLGTVIEQRASR